MVKTEHESNEVIDSSGPPSFSPLGIDQLLDLRKSKSRDVVPGTVFVRSRENSAVRVDEETKKKI